MANNVDNSLVTWLLVVVCTPHCIRNPYLIAKIIEVLFVINPSIQVTHVCEENYNSVSTILITLSFSAGENRGTSLSRYGTSYIKNSAGVVPYEVLYRR